MKSLIAAGALALAALGVAACDAGNNTQNAKWHAVNTFPGTSSSVIDGSVYVIPASQGTYTLARASTSGGGLLCWRVWYADPHPYDLALYSTDCADRTGWLYVEPDWYPT